MRYVLLLQGEKASAFAMGRAEFGVAVVFNNDPAGHQKFLCYLAERSHSLFSLVIDSKDEEHHVDSIPLLKRRDRKRILNKIAGRHFPDCALSAITVDTENSSKGSTCPITASGLPSNNDCEVWLALLKKSSALMTDISSLALLGLAIHQISGSRVSLCALQVAQNDFRLMAYHNTRLVISRHLTVTSNLAAELIDHLQQTRDYLERLHLTFDVHKNSGPAQGKIEENNRPTIEGVQVIGALSADGRAKLEQAGATVMGCRAMSRMLGIKPELSGPFADMLFAALALSRKSKQARLSMGGYKQHYLARRLRHVLYAGSIACFGVTAVAAAAAVHYNGSYSSLIATTGELSSQVQMPDQLKSVSHSEVNFPIDAIRDSMRIAQHINAKTQFTPLHFLSSLATDLTVYPELEVTAIHWSRIDNDYGQILSEVAPQGGSSDAGFYYKATVSGYLKIQSSRVETLGRFNSFVAALTSSDQYESVAVMEAPFSMVGNGVLSQNSLPTRSSQPSMKEPFVIELATGQVRQ